MKVRGTSHLKGDLAGGVTAAILTIPVSMGYGILSLASLGDQYVSYGLLAGLISAIVVPLTAVLLGADSAMMYAPRSIVAFLIGSIVAHSVARAQLPSRDPMQVLSLAFLIVFVAGFIQTLFGRFRLGGLVQYIPSPVMAGFQNAAALLILLSQVDTILGFRQHVPVPQILQHLDAVRPLTLLVGGLTALAMAQAGRLTKRIPPPILGVLVGSGLYYGLVAAGYGPAALGATVGALPSVIPTPAYVMGFATALTSAATWPLLPALLTGAASLAIVASLDGLLCAKTVEGVTRQKIRGSRELLRLGIGNMLAACFGGISSGVNLGASFANYKTGARGSLSVLVSAIAILLALLFLSPVIALIPRAVIAGLLVVVALQLFDRWSLRIARQMLTGHVVYRKSMAIDMLVIVLVATVAIAANLVAAVAIGVGVAILSFLFRMSRSAIRRQYHADHVRSRRTRDPALMDRLLARGREVLVFELEGPIFFGTAEELADRVDAALAHGVTVVILDLKRVNEIDSTGARILLQIHDRVVSRHGELLVSHAPAAGRIAAFLRDMGVTAALGPGRLFDDTDRALEAAEDRLVAGEPDAPRTTEEFPLERLDVLAGFDDGERAVLAEHLSRRTYPKGAIVFSQGDKSRELFIIASGAASVRIHLAGGHRENRLATFSAGTVFGEVALLDEEPRSATIQADEDLVCSVLTETAFETLTREHQAIAIKLLANVGRELSRRLRRANATIHQLES
jgi:anti-anti-sigma factor